MAEISNRDQCAHLLRRFGLGASEAEIDFYLRDGLNGAVDRLLDYENTDEGFNIPLEAFRGKKDEKLRIQGAIGHWTVRLLMTRRPLQERMTLFWHDHFATSAEKVVAPSMMVEQNEVFRKNATGSFRKLLSEVSKDPAMIYWLDNQENVKGHANENFAREVMELFTLGIGHYTEKDVQEGARAFTGWSINRAQIRKQGTAQFEFRPLRHDEGQKTFLGNSADFNGDDILNILCDQPRTAEFLVHKIWDWFVWPNPEPETIEPFVTRFRNSGLDIKGLLRDIMVSREFRSAKAMRSIVKSPADICIATLRQLGVGEQIREAVGADVENAPRAAFAPAASAAQTMKSMGMWLMYPPDVSGWKNGQAWITTATMIERITWADRLFGLGPGTKFPLRYPAYELLQANPTADGVVQKLVSLFDAPVKPERMPVLREAANRACGGRITEANANATATAVAKLIFATPEFQFS